MSVQQLREKIRLALERQFPDIPVYVDGDKPQTAYFHPGLITATYDRQREGRYMAVYRFGVRYEQGTALAAEQIADKLSEALGELDREDRTFRVVRQVWEAAAQGKGPLFTADYMLYLQSEPLQAVKMGRMTGGETVK